LLARYEQGDRRVWRVVRVPTVAEEDARQLPRTWETLAADRTRLINRIKNLLMTQGVQVPIDHEFLTRLRAARATRPPLDVDAPTSHAIAQLQTLRGIGLRGA
jgi:transposase